MDHRIDILDERESLRNPFVGSLAFHAGLVALSFAYVAIQGSSVERWGDPKSLGGGAVGITPVERIPIQSRQGRINPVANDTESQIPSAPTKPQPKQAVREDPKAIALKSRNAQKRPSQTTPQKYSPVKEPRPNHRQGSS